MELFLIRHAESTNNAGKNDAERVADPELTQNGLLQIEYLALFLKKGLHLTKLERENNHKVLDQLYCSATLRALQTSFPIGLSTGLKPEVWSDIHEVGGLYGHNSVEMNKIVFSGLNRVEINKRFLGYILPPDITDRGWWNKEKEKQLASHKRVQRVIQILVERAEEKTRIGMVKHGAFMSLFLSMLFKLLPIKNTTFQHYNSSNSRITFEKKDIIVIQYLN